MNKINCNNRRSIVFAGFPCQTLRRLFFGSRSYFTDLNGMQRTEWSGQLPDFSKQSDTDKRGSYNPALRPDRLKDCRVFDLVIFGEQDRFRDDLCRFGVVVDEW